MEPNKKTAMSTISKTIAEDSTTKKKNLLKHGLETIKRGLNFVWKDLRKTHLIWVKVVFFLQSASLVTLYPYLVYYFLFSFAIIFIEYLKSSVYQFFFYFSDNTSQSSWVYHRRCLNSQQCHTWRRYFWPTFSRLSGRQIG